MAKPVEHNPVRADDPMGARATCGARKRDGTPCRQYPLQGTNRCRLHGGASPQAQAKARERILGAADLAAQRLIQFMNDKKVPYPTRLAAARDLLDRAGLQATTQVEVGLAAPWRDVIAGIVAEVPDEDLQPPKVIDVRPEPPALPPVDVPYDADDGPPPRYTPDWEDDEPPPARTSPTPARRTPPPAPQPQSPPPAHADDTAEVVASEKVPPRRLLEDPHWRAAPPLIDREERGQYGEFSG